MNKILYSLGAALIAASSVACAQQNDSPDPVALATLWFLVLEYNKPDPRNPTVSMTNSNSIPEGYNLYTTNCTGSPAYTFSNPVSPGNTTSALTVVSQSYYVNTTVLCTSDAIWFQDNRAYACVSDGSSVNCSGTPF